MPRRRSSRPLLAVALVVAIAVAAAAAWHAAGGRLAWPGAEPSPTADPGFAVSNAACTVVDAGALAARLGDPATATGTAVPAGVPASGACELAIAGARLALARFDGPSLARMRPPIDPQGYFDSLAVGLEYEFKAPPDEITGLGARAVAGGFDADGDDPAQVVWQRGGAVFVLAARDRMPRERLLAVARAIDATAP
jgi:hypothetical protein